LKICSIRSPGTNDKAVVDLKKSVYENIFTEMRSVAALCCLAKVASAELNVIVYFIIFFIALWQLNK